MLIEEAESIVYDKKDDTFSDVDSDIEDTVLTFKADEPVLDPTKKKLPTSPSGFYYMEDLSKRNYPVYPSDLLKGSEGADLDKTYHIPDSIIEETGLEESPSKAELDKLTERYRAVIASWKD